MKNLIALIQGQEPWHTVPSLAMPALEATQDRESSLSLFQSMAVWNPEKVSLCCWQL